MVHNGAFKDENYCIDHLCIVEFVTVVTSLGESCTHFICRLIAMDKKRFIGSHSDVTSIGPHIVISTLC